MKKVRLGCLCLFLVACSGSNSLDRTPLIKPIDIALTEEVIVAGSRNLQLGYIVDEHSQSVVVFDIRQDRVISTLDGDRWDRTPIPAGENPVAVIVDEEVSPHRVFVADATLNAIWGFTLTDTVYENRNDLQYVPLALGNDFVSIHSRVLFFDESTPSQATLGQIELDNLAEGVDSWRAIHDGDETLRVLSAKQGEQSTKAFMNQAFQSDDETVSFTPQRGARRLRGPDRFYFTTLKAKPLQINAKPVALAKYDRKMFILTQNPDEITVFDLDNLSVDESFAISSSDATTMVYFDDYLWVTDNETNTVEQINVEDYSSQTFTINDFPDFAVSSLLVRNDQLFLISEKSFTAIAWDFVTQTVEQTIELSDRPNQVKLATLNSIDHAVIPLKNGNIDLVRLSTLERVDTNTSRESDFQNLQFYDLGPSSEPELVSVGTFDGITRSENWQLIFEGILPMLNQVEANINGAQVTFSGLDLSETGIVEGDQLITSDGEGLIVASIDSATMLTLSSTPDAQGTQTIDVRSVGHYIAIGSKSGLQLARVEPDQTYESDGGEIALFVRSSLDKPVTQGDFFVFQTTDGINPISSNGRSLASNIALIQKSGQNYMTGYVLYQGSGALGRINFKDQRLRKIIR